MPNTPDALLPSTKEVIPANPPGQSAGVRRRTRGEGDIDVFHSAAARHRFGPKLHRLSKRPPFECVALLLQGGGERLEVPGQLFRCIVAIAEIHDALRPICSSLAQVNGLESKALDELVYSLVIAVDEFTAPFAGYPISPGRCIRVHTTTNAVGRFIDAARETGVLQGQGGVESRNTSADDSNLGHCSAPVEITVSSM